VALTEVDRSLLNRCLAGEPASWQDLVDRFLGLFIHVVHHTAHARSVRMNPEDVDDLCAEVFLALLERNYAVLRGFRGECSLATYLTVVARRVIVREMARRRMAEALGHVNAHQAAIDVAGNDRRNDRPEVQRIDNRDEVQKMLAGLPDMDAKIVRQYHIEGRSYREISVGLGVPENSIGPALSRARAKLRSREVRL
jgi:RNA polymerase sigma-70 factor (ECF subfamily)